MGFFAAAHQWRRAKRSLPKICHTYPTTMMIGGTVIPYLKKMQNIYELRDTLLEFCWYQHFHRKPADFPISRIQIKISFWYIISNSFYESFQIFFKYLVTILTVLIKVATLGVLKIKSFWRHQENFIKWFKIYCKCSHVTKVS